METTINSKFLASSLSKTLDILLTRIMWQKAQTAIQLTLVLLILSSAFCLDAFTYFRIGNISEKAETLNDVLKFKYGLYLGTGFSINLFGIFVSNILLRNYRYGRTELKSLQEEFDSFNKLILSLDAESFPIEINEFMQILPKELFYHAENNISENIPTDKTTSEMVSALKEILLKAVAK